MAQNFLHLLSPHLTGDSVTNEALDSMTQYYTLIHTSWHTDYQHVMHWCNLAQHFYQHKNMQLTAPLSFVVDNHETDCYWYEVFWRVHKLSERCIKEVKEELSPDEVPASVSNDADTLRHTLQRIKEVIGAIAFVREHIRTHCHWAKRHMEDRYNELQENWVTLRLMGYWIQGCLLYNSQDLKDAASTWHATKDVKVDEAGHYRPRRSSTTENLQTNATIYCNVALGRMRRLRGAFGYAIAHYRAANMLGYMLNEEEEALQKQNERLLTPVPAPSLDIVSSEVLPVPPLFLKGVPVIGKVAFVFK